MTQRFIALDLGHATTIAYWSDTKEVERLSSNPTELAAWVEKVQSLPESSILLAEDPWEPAVQAALLAGLTVETVNPYKLSKFRSAISPGNAKDDVRDAKTEAKFRLVCPEAFRRLSVPSQELAGLRITLEAREDALDDSKRKQNRLRSILRTAFPALLQALPDGLERQWVLQLLQECPTSLDVHNLSDARALKRLHKAFKTRDDEQLRTLLSINPCLVEGSSTQMLRERIRWEAATLVPLVSRVTQLRGELKRQLDALAEQQNAEEGLGVVEILRSFPQAGPIIVTQLLVELPVLLDGEVPEIEALRAHSGIRPVTHQSGGKKVVVMRRARSIRLNNALTLLASVAMQKSPKVRARYRGLRDRGKEHQTALRITASSILDILHAMLSKRTLYVEPEIRQRAAAAEG